ncbi:hypothetical protein [Salmonella phage vB_SenM-S16]|uniref:Uncharacterized protein n=1 Tax=Salmonella phage S16 TaxID=1087482 RepID=M1H955_BPS16|nr:hypothetical protein I133_gp204 [Salmonella phage vB_SenM-S16]AGE48154.1 hypothetical protein [Salmonella phage vB_SenM-S16]
MISVFLTRTILTKAVYSTSTTKMFYMKLTRNT